MTKTYIAASFWVAAQDRREVSNNYEVVMRTSLLVGLIVTLCFAAGIGTAAADSFMNYPDGSRSEAVNLFTFGTNAFIFYDYPGDDDILVHAVNGAGNLEFIQVTGTSFQGWGLWLDFDGFSGSFLRYRVHGCLGTQTSCNYTFLGTLFL